MDKDVRKFVQSIEHIPGVEVIEGTKHLRVWKDGKAITTIPSTPSDHRWRANCTAQLRRAGITPSVRPPNGKRELAVAGLMPVEEIRARLSALPLAEFARFVLAWQETSGVEGWGNEASAYSAIGQWRRSETGLKAKTHERLDGALRAWDRVESARSRTKEALALDTDAEEVEIEAITDPDEPESIEAALMIRIDRAKLDAALARFGVQLVIE